MNYQKIYDQLIEKRKQYPLDKKDCYCEKHHIIPRCLGGSNDKTNLINLTAREHYVAHCLLVKIAEQKHDKHMYHKMLRAWSAMSFFPAETIHKFRLHEINKKSCLYEAIKIKLSNYFSESFSKENGSIYGKKPIWNIETLQCTYIQKDAMPPKGWTDVRPEELRRYGKSASCYNKIAIYKKDTHEVRFISKDNSIPDNWIKGLPKEKRQTIFNNPTKGKIWIMNLELEQVKLWPKNVCIPNGWIKGRPANNESVAEYKIRKKLENDKLIQKKEKQNNRIIQYQEYYKIYSNYGWETFKEITKYPYSKQNLLRTFTKLLPEYIPQNGKTRGK